MLPFFAVYNPPVENTQAKQLSALFGEQILICTDAGFKWVKLADLLSGKEKPEPHPDYKCPLCYIASHGMKALAPASFAVAYDHGRTHPPVFAYHPLSIAFPSASPLNVRAPPVSFIG